MNKEVIQLIKDDLEVLEQKLNSMKFEEEEDLLDALLNLTVIFKEFVRQLDDKKEDKT